MRILLRAGHASLAARIGHYIYRVNGQWGKQDPARTSFDRRESNPIKNNGIKTQKEAERKQNGIRTEKIVKEIGSVPSGHGPPARRCSEGQEAKRCVIALRSSKASARGSKRCLFPRISVKKSGRVCGEKGASVIINE